jgi:hypothetical protein
MWAKFNALSITWKIAIGVVLLAVVILIFDATTGYVRQGKNWLFDRQQAKIEAENTKLLEENEKLREENRGFLVEIEKLKVKEKVVDEQIEKIGGQLEKNKEATEQALEEVNKEIAETNLPTDARTRCERLKAKLIERKISSAKDIQCNEIQ